MNKSIVKLGAPVAVCFVLAGCIGSYEDDQAEGVAAPSSMTPIVEEPGAIGDPTAVEGAQEIGADDRSDTPLSDGSDESLAGSILESSADEETDASYLSCVGWENGGRLCLAKCAGMTGWQYTGWAYPGIQYGDCIPKGNKFCSDHGSYRTNSCWGVW